MQTPKAIIFRHARWRVLILGFAGLILGPLMVWQSWNMLDPAWHTEASRGTWFNHVPPLLRAAFMLGAGALLSVIGVINIWVVLRRSPALIIDEEGVTTLRVLQRQFKVSWREVTHMEEGKGRLLVHRSSGKPLVIGYDWFDAAPAELQAAMERQWRAKMRT